MDPLQFIRSWPALWLWMHELNEGLTGAALMEAYTFRKGRLDLQFQQGESLTHLSWEKQGNQVLITSSETFSQPKRRVKVFQGLRSGIRLLSVQVHGLDRLLRLDFDDGSTLILGCFPGAGNVYHTSQGIVKDQFLKQPGQPEISENWLTPADPVPTPIPGRRVSAEELLSTRQGLTADWDDFRMIFTQSKDSPGLNISTFVRAVLRHKPPVAQKPGETLKKLGQTVKKRWETKADKIRKEWEQAHAWPTLERELTALRIALGAGLQPADGVVTIPGEYFPEGEPQRITLEPGQTLIQLIELKAQRIRKFKGKLESLEGVLIQVDKDITDLEKLLSGEDETGLKGFLEAHGEALDKQGQQRTERKPYKEYASPNGFPILVGRSSRDNDNLTLKIAGKNDWWFHARQIRGSHVILRTGNQTPGKEDIEAAARHAALNSNAKHSGVVVVQYCQRKHLSKPKGSAPGAVLVHQEQSITINLD